MHLEFCLTTEVSAFHTGSECSLLNISFILVSNQFPVPEIKAVSRITRLGIRFFDNHRVLKILGGYVFDSFLSSWTLLIKALGLALSVSSGLSLGKEVKSTLPDPLLHLIVSGAFGTCIMLHVVPLHEAFLTVSSKRRYASSSLHYLAQHKI
jgi:hypothetical protein